MPTVPLFNLALQLKPLHKKIAQEWQQIVQTTQFTHGTETTTFEKKFAALCQRQYAVGMRSGTASLLVALKAAGITTGDEVITTPMTFTATTDAILYCGAKPVFVDVEPETGNLNSAQIAAKITAKTKAILLVHLYGVPCDMVAITKIARAHHLKVIEDASHAHGSLYQGKPVGSFGLVGCFSLYPSKTLGAAGNAGVIVSSDSAFIKRAKMFANHGVKTAATKYIHHVNGLNELIDNVQAAVLNVKLPHLQKWIKQKQRLAKIYNQTFHKNGHPGMIWPADTSPSLYVYAVQIKQPKHFRDFCAHRGVETGVYYPIPLHLQPSLAFLGYKKGDFPVTELFASQTVSLPLYPELTPAQIKQVTDTIQAYFKAHGKRAVNNQDV